MFEKLLSEIFDKRISKLEEIASERAEQTGHQIRFNQECIKPWDLQTKINNELIERIRKLEERMHEDRTD